VAKHPPLLEFDEVTHIDNSLDLIVGQAAKKGDFIAYFSDVLHPDLHAITPSDKGPYAAMGKPK
jgi:hypothetical protein